MAVGAGEDEEDENSTFFPLVEGKVKETNSNSTTFSEDQENVSNVSLVRESEGVVDHGNFHDEHDEKSRPVSSAPRPFFKSQKWLTPDAYLASNQHTTSPDGSGMTVELTGRPPRFPLSRLVLWDRTTCGDSVDLNSKDFVPRRLEFRGEALNAILGQVRRGNASGFLLAGGIDGIGVGQRIAVDSEILESEAEINPSGELASVSGASKSLGIEFSCFDSEEELQQDVAEDPKALLDLRAKLRRSLDSVHGFGLGAILPISCKCCTTKGSKSKELLITGTLLLPSQRLTLRPIYPLLTRNTTLSNSLFSVLRKDKTGCRRDSERTGFLTMDQGHRLLPLLESEPLAKEMPLLGVWVACGRSGARNPLVFAAAVRFMYSKSIVERSLQSGQFLLLLFAAGTGAPQCFECSFELRKGYPGAAEGLPKCVAYTGQTKVYPEDLGEDESVAFSFETDATAGSMSEEEDSKIIAQESSKQLGDDEEALEGEKSGLDEDSSGSLVGTSELDGLLSGASGVMVGGPTGEDIPPLPRPTLVPAPSALSIPPLSSFWSPPNQGGAVSVPDISSTHSQQQQQMQQMQMQQLQVQLQKLQEQLEVLSKSRGEAKENGAGASTTEEPSEIESGEHAIMEEEKEKEEEESAANDSKNSGDESSPEASAAEGEEKKESSALEEGVEKVETEASLAKEGSSSSIEMDAENETPSASRNIFPEGEIASTSLQEDTSESDDSNLGDDTTVVPLSATAQESLLMTTESELGFFPKVRYTPLSDEESEDEEELNKILSKYLPNIAV